MAEGRGLLYRTPIRARPAFVWQNNRMETSQTPNEFSVKDLHGSPENPRTINDQQYKALDTSMRTFGDLSCVVRNVRSNHLVGGHQRTEIFKAAGDAAKVVITQRYAQATTVGTVARGYVVIGEESFGYREVDWDEETEKSANIAANAAHGSFDQQKLADITASLSTTARKLTGQSQDKINELLKRSSAKDGAPAVPKIRKFSADEMRPFAREFYVEDEDSLATVMQFLDYVAESTPLNV